MTGDSLPVWAWVIEISLEWKTPPWEIVGETEIAARTKWLFRLQTYRTERNRAQKQLEKTRK